MRRLINTLKKAYWKLSVAKNRIIGRIRFIRDRKEYRNQSANEKDKRFLWKWDNEYPILCDRFKNAGIFDGHYFLQDLVFAREIIDARPEMIYDIGSRVDGFIAHLLSAKIEVTMIDIRPLPINIQNLHFLQGNATDMKNIVDNTVNYISCLHALEHFGLGRYGDPVDYNGWKKALHEFERILNLGGKLYLSVPIGPKDKVMFNAHRIFKPSTIVNELSKMKLIRFAYIKDYAVHVADVEKYNDEEYLCGMFIFEKGST